MTSEPDWPGLIDIVNELTPAQCQHDGCTRPGDLLTLTRWGDTYPSWWHSSTCVLHVPVDDQGFATFPVAVHVDGHWVTTLVDKNADWGGQSSLGWVSREVRAVDDGELHAIWVAVHLEERGALTAAALAGALGRRS